MIARLERHHHRIDVPERSVIAASCDGGRLGMGRAGSAMGGYDKQRPVASQQATADGGLGAVAPRNSSAASTAFAIARVMPEGQCPIIEEADREFDKARTLRFLGFGRQREAIGDPQR